MERESDPQFLLHSVVTAGFLRSLFIGDTCLRVHSHLDVLGMKLALLPHWGALHSGFYRQITVCWSIFPIPQALRQL